MVARFFKGPQAAHEGRRVVEGQRLMQAASDLFLGWTKGPFGRHFYMRQLRDMKLSPQLELMDAEVFGRYAALCGWVLARAHAKGSGLAAEVSGYLGRRDRMTDAMVGYANGYADQVERDYAAFPPPEGTPVKESGGLPSTARRNSGHASSTATRLAIHRRSRRLPPSAGIARP